MIYILPWGDINQASSRLRVYNILPYLGFTQIGVPEQYSKGDVLFIQKRPEIEQLRRAKKAGIKVVYDVDDKYDEFQEMIDEADVVTVDTEEKKKWIPNAIVIPDSLDWDGTVKKDGESGIIGWTGYGNNTKYLNGIDIPKEYTLRFITSPDWIHYYKDIQAQSRPWSLDMVDKYLAQCEFGIYYLPDSEFEQAKGMHKLLKNWAIGLPTYTSRMPDYVKAMNEAGVGEKYIVDDWSKLKNIGFDEKCREYAMRYKAEEIAKQWKKVL